jgi:predicted TIM-barrel fold metal-dependent hydrolase
MIIDAHAHLGASWLAWYPYEVDENDLIKLYDKFGVDKACISSFKIFYDPRGGNDEIFEAVQKYPNRFIGFAVVSPRYGPHRVAEEIDRCVQKLGMKGLKVHPAVGAWHADSLAVNPVMEKAREYNLPILFHSGTDKYSNPRAIGNVARRYPEVTIIMGHMGGEDYFEAIQIAKAHDNILLDTTGSLDEAMTIKQAVEEVGAKRVVWGSDSPALILGVELAKIEYADISEKEKRMILGENMTRVLNLN